MVSSRSPGYPGANSKTKNLRKNTNYPITIYEWVGSFISRNRKKAYKGVKKWN